MLCTSNALAAKQDVFELISPFCAQRPTLQAVALTTYALAPPTSAQTAL